MAWLINKADLHLIESRWRGVNWLWIAVAPLLLQIAVYVLRAFRQRFLLLVCGIDVPARWLVLVQVKANFVRSFVPGGISADIYRTYVVARTTGRGFMEISSCTTKFCAEQPSPCCSASAPARSLHCSR